MIKRAFDMLLSGLGLLALGPIMLAIAIAVRRDGGPAIYSQFRVGRKMRPFRIYKFRTMVQAADRIAYGPTVDGDPRITPVGRVLRATKLDELPQLYNVLCGDMSLVGPRPELPEYVWRFRDEYREILQVRPGLTDPASIAYRNEGALLAGKPDPEEFYLHDILPDKIRLSRRYVANASLLNDLKILIETVVVLGYPAPAVEQMIEWVAPGHRLVTGLVQMGLAALAFLCALAMHFGGSPPPEIMRPLAFVLPIVVIVRAFWFDRMQLTRDVWHYFGASEAFGIVAACALGSVTLGVVTLGPPPFHDIPPAVLVIDFVLCAAFLAGARLARCLNRRIARKALAKRRVLVVGTDEETERVVHGLADHPLHDYMIVGLVGPKSFRSGLTVHDIPVLGCFRQLPEIIADHEPDEIIVVSSEVSSEEEREVVRQCRQADCLVRVVPDLSDVASGCRRIQFLDPPENDQLLFREPIEVEIEGLRQAIAGRRVLVTGAGGSIGSEICRQVASLGPAQLAMFEKHEESLYNIERSIRASYPDVDVEPLLADVRDTARVNQVFTSLRPEMIFHAAAYKHVPMLERNPLEAVKTNLVGTWVVAEAADRAGVETFVLISTDKAVDPVNVLGATKRMAEIAVHSMSGSSSTRFLSVRFGNVLGSSGSVLPLFREQIQKGGPVTVTHPDITRWFMTVPEAVRLIITSTNLATGGEVFVLDMGKPVRIVDLAFALIRQYGLRPGRDVPIKFTGLRPGERLYERLFGESEVVMKTSHPRILMARNGHSNGNGRPQDGEEFRRLLGVVQNAAGGVSHDLREVVADLEVLCA